MCKNGVVLILNIQPVSAKCKGTPYTDWFIYTCIAIQAGKSTHLEQRAAVAMDLNLDSTTNLKSWHLVTHGLNSRQSLRLVAVAVLHSRPENCAHATLYAVHFITGINIHEINININKSIDNSMLCRGLIAVLMRRQSCVEAYAEDAQAPASSFGSEKEGSLSKA